MRVGWRRVSLGAIVGCAVLGQSGRNRALCLSASRRSQPLNEDFVSRTPTDLPRGRSMNLENSDRRRYARTKPPRLLHVRFGEGNDAVLLNASLDGLCFQATSPVESSRPLDVTISRSPSSSINARGKIAWTSRERNVGGLQFLDATYGALSTLGAWLVEPSPTQSEGTSQGSLPSLPLEFPLPNTEVRPPKPATPPPMAAPTPASRSETDDLPEGRLLLEDSKNRLPFAESPAKPRTARTPLIALALLAVASAYVLISVNARHTLGSWLIHLGEYVNSDSATANQQAPPAASARSVEQQGPSAGESSGMRDPQAAPATNSFDPTEKSPEESRSSSALKLESPNQIPSARAGNSPADKISQLWSAVARGDANAEVSLARVYLNGDGVNKNCEQARVLLVAASKRRNAEATRELRKLRAHGCTGR